MRRVFAGYLLVCLLTCLPPGIRVRQGKAMQVRAWHGMDDEMSN